MNRLRHQDGAAAVEFGLLLPLLVMLAFGIIEFSTAYNRTQGMHAAVREGARMASSSTAFAPVARSDLETRVLNSLQTNDGGSGFPAPGGSAGNAASQLEADVSIQVTNLTDDGPEVLGPGDFVCVPETEVDRFEITASIVEDRRDEYGLELPLIPGSPFDLSMESEGVFRCTG